MSSQLGLTRETGGGREELNGPVCGTKCNAQPNGYGPTCFAEAVGSLGHLYDCFTCRHRDEDRYHYASQLIAWKRECASRRVRELINLDLQETLTFRSVL